MESKFGIENMAREAAVARMIQSYEQEIHEIARVSNLLRQSRPLRPAWYCPLLVRLGDGMVTFGLVFLYIPVEFLLDYALKIDFRKKWITHAPYIVLEYIALFSLIAIAFDIDRTWGYLVSISFWILIVSLVYAYWDRIKIGKKEKKITPR